MKNTIQKAKQQSAFAASEYIKSGQIIGIGSGTTVSFLVEQLRKNILDGLLSDICCIPASYQSELELRRAKIPIGSLYDYPEPDITIDGADEIDNQFNLIKGGGAALTREKILASAARQFIIVADYQKKVDKLGLRWAVPMEVIPFGLGFVYSEISKLGAKPVLRIAKQKNGPIITDNGNFIIDAKFQDISSPQKIARKLKAIPGIIEHGLFCDMVDVACIGYPDHVESVKIR
ncbi:MAG: ribose 5-phosphate isomerase A [Candidatus Ranarchaeia archaeon]